MFLVFMCAELWTHDVMDRCFKAHKMISKAFLTLTVSCWREWVASGFSHREKRYKDRGTTQHDGFFSKMFTLMPNGRGFFSHVSSFVNAFFVLGSSLIPNPIYLQTSIRNPSVWNKVLGTNKEGRSALSGKVAWRQLWTIVPFPEPEFVIFLRSPEIDS